MINICYVVFNLEKNGLSKNFHNVVELCAVVMDEKGIIKGTHFLLDAVLYTVLDTQKNSMV